ncbi:MAG: hypothetical protein AB7U82_03910 [Blastocatellales bacterium]
MKNIGSAAVEDARELTRRLRLLHGGVSARELARILGVEISKASWRVAGGKIIYFAECSISPPKIVLNIDAIELAARSGACFGKWECLWFTPEQIAEVVIAHELYHILTRQSSSPEVESAAHEFARRYTGVPFSLSRYDAALKQAGKEQISSSSTSSHHISSF